jgi:hypothetical protein
LAPSERAGEGSVTVNQQATRASVIAAVIALVFVLGFLTWRTFGNQAQVADLQTIRAHQAKKAYN